VLFLALVTSVFVVAVATAAIVRGGGWIVAFVVLGVGDVFFSALLMVAVTPPTFLWPMLLIAVCYRASLRTWPRRLVAIGVPCLITFAATMWSVQQEEQRLAQLRTEYPYVSLANHLPERTAGTAHAALNDQAQRRLDDVELELGERRRFEPGEERRVELLRTLHEDTTRLFVDSPGFGSSRMSGRWTPAKHNLEGFKPKRQEPIKQPKAETLSASAEGESWKPQPPEPGLDELHREGVVEFVNPAGFGYVKDRQHVAGFKSHRFGEAVKPKEKWTVASVELVGLLLHPHPVVYVSPNLPNMEELRGAPTRPLDRFEAAGLEAIQRGEDLFVGQTPSGTRMIGAIRSAKQCLQCHEGNRGDLLGAFSYRLEATAK